MIKQTELVIPPENLNDKDFFYKSASEKLKLNPSEITAVVSVKRSIDARSRNPVFRILCNVFIKHTTACITTADLDPGTDIDMLEAFEKIIPDLKYRHPHNPSHVGDHIVSSIIGPSLTLWFEGNKLVLGTWQRLVLVEMDGPRQRNIILSFV